VIVALPALRIVTTFPSIVATDVFELVYENAPSLFDVGATIVNVASPNVLVGIEKLVITGLGSNS